MTTYLLSTTRLVLEGEHRISQGYSPADENAGLAYALRDDDL